MSNVDKLEEYLDQNLYKQHSKSFTHEYSYHSQNQVRHPKAIVQSPAKIPDPYENLTSEYVQLKSVLQKMQFMKKKRAQLLQDMLNFDDSFEDYSDDTEFDEATFQTLLFGKVEPDTENEMADIEYSSANIHLKQEKLRKILQEMASVEDSGHISSNVYEQSRLFTQPTTILTPVKSKTNGILDFSQPTTPKFNPSFT